MSDLELTVEVTRYPMYMTGKLLRKRLGIPEHERVFADKSFKVCAKFKGIKQPKRLAFLRKMATKVIRPLTFDEMRTQRVCSNSHN